MQERKDAFVKDWSKVDQNCQRIIEQFIRLSDVWIKIYLRWLFTVTYLPRLLI